MSVCLVCVRPFCSLPQMIADCYSRWIMPKSMDWDVQQSHMGVMFKCYILFLSLCTFVWPLTSHPPPLITGLQWGREGQQGHFTLVCRDTAGEQMARGGEHVLVSIVHKEKKNWWVNDRAECFWFTKWEQSGRTHSRFFFFFKHPAEASSAILQFWCQDWLCFASSSAHLLRTDPDPEQLCVELFLSLWLEEAGPYRELFQMI